MSHPDSAEIIRVAADMDDRTVGGETFHGTKIDVELSDEAEGVVPSATVTVRQFGRVLDDWLLSVDGGIGGKAIWRSVNAAGEIGLERTYDIISAVSTAEAVQWVLGFSVELQRPLVRRRYDAEDFPALYGLRRTS